MKIAFTFEDTWIYQISGIRSPKRRVVNIELTQEQLALLNPKFVGTSAGENKFEEIISIHIEDTTA